MAPIPPPRRTTLALPGRHAVDPLCGARPAVGLPATILSACRSVLVRMARSRKARTPGRRSRKRSGPEPAGDRGTPVLAEAAARDANSHRGLATLVFVELDEPGHALHIGAGKAAGDDGFDGLVVFHVARHDRVEHLIGRQAVLVC